MLVVLQVVEGKDDELPLGVGVCIYADAISYYYLGIRQLGEYMEGTYAINGDDGSMDGWKKDFGEAGVFITHLGIREVTKNRKPILRAGVE